MLRTYLKIFYYDLLLKNVRNPSFKNNLLSTISRAVLSSIAVFWTAVIGWKAIAILQFLFPKENPYYLLNHYLIVSIIVIYIWRNLRSYRSYFKIVPFHILHISKNYLFSYIILRNIVNKVSIRFFIFFVSFFLFNLISKYSLQAGLFWLVDAIFLLLIFELFLYITNILSIHNLFVLAFSAILHSVFLYLILRHLINRFELLHNSLLQNSILLFSLFITMVLLIYISAIVTNKNIYVDINRKNYSSKLFELQFLLKKRPLIWLQIKLIIRNKLLKKILFSNIIFIAAGLIVGIFAHPIHPGQKIISMFLIVLFSTGYFFILPYGTNIFGWENYYSGFLFTKNITLKNYLDSKITFIQYYWLMMVIIIALFSPIMSLHYSLLVLLFLIYFYTALTYIIIIQAVYSFQSRNPETSSLRYFNKVTYFTGGAVSFPFLLFFLSNSSYNNINYIFIILMLSISIITLLTQKFIYDKLLNYLKINRYKIMGEWD